MKSLKATILIASLLMLFGAISLDMEAKKAKHVILIGLDGWGGYSIPKADMPNAKSMMADGAWTMKKRSVLPSSSAINWASMFMGVGTEGHGYTQWGSQHPEIPSIALSSSPDSIFPTIFRVIRDQRPDAETGILYEWDGIGYLVDSLATSYHRHVPVADNNDSSPLTKLASQYIKESKPAFAAFIYDNPDHVGHSYGHDTPEYYAILKYLDGQIGEIIEATKEAGIYDETVFILTADHGGIEKGHGGITLQEMETPFIIAGPGIRNIGEFKSAMMQYDVAGTVARLLDVTPPQPWVGRPVTEILK